MPAPNAKRRRAMPPPWHALPPLRGRPTGLELFVIRGLVLFAFVYLLFVAAAIGHFVSEGWPR
jgi:hypothetical protein